MVGLWPREEARLERAGMGQEPCGAYSGVAPAAGAISPGGGIAGTAQGNCRSRSTQRTHLLHCA